MKPALENALRSLLDTHFSDTDDILSNRNGWEDAVQVLLNNTKQRNETFYKAPRTITREDHIHRRLGHIVVSPKDAYNNKALIDTYIYCEQDGQSDPKYVNKNPQSTESFINELIQCAKHSSEVAIGKEKPADIAGIEAASPAIPGALMKRLQP